MSAALAVVVTDVEERGEEGEEGEGVRGGESGFTLMDSFESDLIYC